MAQILCQVKNSRIKEARCIVSAKKADPNETWIKVDTGIRCREHPTRKHGVKPDRYFVLRFTVDGKTHQEALGWASEGMTLAKARVELSRIKEAKRTGEGARSLRERREQAEEARKVLETEVERAKVAKIDFACYWNETYWPAQGHKAKGSLVAETALWEKWLAPVIGKRPLSSVSATDLEKVKSSMMQQGKAPASIKYAMAVVSQVWTMAFRAGIVVGVCPTKLVTLPKKDNRRQRFLTKEETKALLNALAQRSPIAHDMAILGLDCGLRFGEIAALCWEDCNFDKGQVLLRDPKAKANRFAFMTNRVKTMLEGRKEANFGLVFVDTNGNKLSRVSKTFRRIADEMFNADVVDPRLRVCFHTLRHTFASWLVEGGVSLYEVKELMGHADFSMTQRYSHLSPEGLRAAVKILEN